MYLLSRLSFFISIFIFLLFSSCGDKYETYNLLNSRYLEDLQNGYWRTSNFRDAGFAVFDYVETGMINYYWIDLDRGCISYTSSEPYTLLGDQLSYGNSVSTLSIEDDELTIITFSTGGVSIFTRMNNLDFEECD